MTSVIDICNQALGEIRAGSINSLNESSLQAQQCKLNYPYVRDTLLREAPWGFARRVEELALRNDRIFNWAYLYQYPQDCLNISRLILNYESVTDSNNGVYRHRRIEDLHTPDLNRQVAYSVYNVGNERVIASNEQQLRIEYTSRVENTNLFDPTFTQTLVYLLASRLAVPVVGGEIGRAFRSDNLAMYQAYLNSAIANDQNDEYYEDTDSDFIAVRNR